jgi:hypothetical protein
MNERMTFGEALEHLRASGRGYCNSTMLAREMRNGLRSTPHGSCNCFTKSDIDAHFSDMEHRAATKARLAQIGREAVERATAATPAPRKSIKVFADARLGHRTVEIEG